MTAHQRESRRERVLEKHDEDQVRDNDRVNAPRASATQQPEQGGNRHSRYRQNRPRRGVKSAHIIVTA